MKVKAGNTWPAPRDVRGGSPQGTKIGNFLFVVTIEAIEEARGTLAGYVPPAITDPIHEQETMTSRPSRFAARPIDQCRPTPPRF